MRKFLAELIVMACAIPITAFAVVTEGPAKSSEAPECYSGFDNFGNRQFEAAAADFDICLEKYLLKQKIRALALERRGIARDVLGKTDLASEDYAAATKLDHGLKLAPLGLGNTLLREGKYAQAMEAYDQSYLNSQEGDARESIVRAAGGTWTLEPKEDDLATACTDWSITIEVIPEAERYMATFASGEQVEADILAMGRSGLIIRYDNEDRLTDGGEPVVWLLHMIDDHEYKWRRADWTLFGGYTGTRVRCP